MTLICASKYFTDQQIKMLYDKGISHFGENKVYDLLEKKEKLNELPLTWHLIGHLQTNKVKDIINEIDFLHTLDRIKLAEVIQKYRHEPISCFIQLNLTDEPQKSGLKREDLPEFLVELRKYDKINVVGFMTMGMVDNIEKTEEAFKELDQLAIDYQLPFRSMGMSDDYRIALKYHSTHLRIGRKIWDVLEENEHVL